MSLCFREAHLAYHSKDSAEIITRSQLLESYLAHLRGVRHNEDMPLIMVHIGTWGGALRDVQLRNDYKPLQNTSNWTTLLNACAEGDYPTFQSTIATFDLSEPLPNTTCRLSRGPNSHPDILRYCFRLGAKLDDNLSRSCRDGARTFEIMKVLYDVDWDNTRTSTKAAQWTASWFGDDSLQGVWLQKYALLGGETVDMNDHKGPNGRLTPHQIHEAFGGIKW